MATISAIILQADQKADGTYNVKIRIWQNNKPAYIDTIHFVGTNQVKKKTKDSKTLVIKDTFVADRIAPDLKKYRDWITDNAELVEGLTAKRLKQYLLDYENYLKKPRKLKRLGGGGTEYEQSQDGLKKGELINHMRDLRNLFNRAMEHYYKVRFEPPLFNCEHRFIYMPII